jgi:DNA adenine methylase
MRPFIKWVGGKQQLAEQIITRLPSFDVFIEPFCGSAAIFFNIFSSLDSCSLYESSKTAVLSDRNRLLINTHITVAKGLPELECALAGYESGHQSDPTTFYKAQASRIKELKLKDGDYDVDAAALFIYLNKAAFNGIWRVNSKGGFNTPWNQKIQLNLVSRHIQECSVLLNKYATINGNLNKETFFFLDPPYIPLSATASFVGYTEGGWGDTENNMLLESMEAIDRSGAKFMMTNSNAPLVKELFGKWNIVEVMANRMIKASKDRPTVMESLITNY